MPSPLRPTPFQRSTRTTVARHGEPSLLGTCLPSRLALIALLGASLSACGGASAVDANDDRTNDDVGTQQADENQQNGNGDNGGADPASPDPTGAGVLTQGSGAEPPSSTTQRDFGVSEECMQGGRETFITLPDGAMVLDPALPSAGGTTQLGSDAEGVRGDLFFAASPRGVELEVEHMDGQLCFRGNLGRVSEADYASYWGAEVGLLLTDSALDGSAASGGLSANGFRFRLDGQRPVNLRVRVSAAGEDPLTSQYCAHVDQSSPDQSIAIDPSAPAPTEARDVEVSLSALSYECWSAGGAAFPAGAEATLVSFQLPANELCAQEFDFCVSEFRVVR